MPSLLEPADGAQRPVPDLRAVLLGVSAWAGGLAVFGLPGWTCLVLLALGAVTVAARRRRGRPVVTVLACLLAASAVGGVAALRVEANRDSPVARAGPRRRGGHGDGAGVVRPGGAEREVRDLHARPGSASRRSPGAGSAPHPGAGAGDRRRGLGRRRAGVAGHGDRRAGSRAGAGPGRRCSRPGATPRRWRRRGEVLDAAARVRAGSGARWRGRPRTPGRWCRRSWSATTSRCPTRWSRTSAPAGSPTSRRCRAPTSRWSSASWSCWPAGSASGPAG